MKLRRFLAVGVAAILAGSPAAAGGFNRSGAYAQLNAMAEGGVEDQEEAFESSHARRNGSLTVGEDPGGSSRPRSGFLTQKGPSKKKTGGKIDEKTIGSDKGKAGSDDGSFSLKNILWVGGGSLVGGIVGFLLGGPIGGMIGSFLGAIAGWFGKQHLG